VIQLPCEWPSRKVRRMTATTVQDRKDNAAEYLQLLRSLAGEMERAIEAITHNALSDLEESVSNQQTISARLLVLAVALSGPLKSNPVTTIPLKFNSVTASPARPADNIDAYMIHQVLVANESLQKLNRRYAALLEHSSRSVALMSSLFDSLQGQFKEASGPRLKHQTWSCQM
jgi:hypothetical protein